MILINSLAKLTSGLITLWCYALWYLFFFCKYFTTDIRLWSCSAGISLFVGFALNINAFGSLKNILHADNKWQVFRFFAIPFFVSSFPVFIQGKDFLLFFSPDLLENVQALSLCLIFLLVTYCAKKMHDIL